MIYSTVTYRLGDTQEEARKKALPAQAKAYGARGEPTPAETKRELDRAKRSLERWLSYRTKAGSSPALRAARADDEQALAKYLHTLLTRAGFQTAELPVPNVAVDPEAAVKLASLVILGETPGAVPQGMIWFLVVPVAALAWVISRAIQSQADLAAEKERLRCIEAGACTDSGFWMKAGAVAIIGWLAWDKFGLKEAAGRLQRTAAGV